MNIPQMTESDAAAHLREKHLRMVMNEQQAGRQIPAVPVSRSQVGEATARMSVEASQATMRAATRRSFIVNWPFPRKESKS